MVHDNVFVFVKKKKRKKKKKLIGDKMPGGSSGRLCIYKKCWVEQSSPCISVVAAVKWILGTGMF